MKEGKVRNDKAEKPRAPSSSALDAIEARVEALVDVVKGLAAENARLKIGRRRRPSRRRTRAARPPMLLARYEDERNAVKERIERVLKTLDEGAGANKA